MEVSTPVGNAHDSNRIIPNMHVSLHKVYSITIYESPIKLLLNYRSSYIKYSTSYFRPFIGSRSWRRSMSWMLVTMHSNISAYLWVSYFILTYTMCWSSYKLPDKSLNWDYIQLVTFGGLRTGKRWFSSWIDINVVDIIYIYIYVFMYIDILNGSFAFLL